MNTHLFLINYRVPPMRGNCLAYDPISLIANKQYKIFPFEIRCPHLKKLQPAQNFINQLIPYNVKIENSLKWLIIPSTSWYSERCFRE